MKDKDINQLDSELQDVGASPQEAESLAKLALLLRELNGQEPHFARPLDLSPSPHRRLRALIYSLSAVGVLAIGLLIASLAQTAFPGNLLYPVKRLTENVAVVVQPGYRGVLMMRRAQEVKQLVATNKNPSLVNSALQSYRSEVAQYTNGNYADYEYCENTLHQAENISSGAERAAIAYTIASVKTQTD